MHERGIVPVIREIVEATKEQDPRDRARFLLVSTVAAIQIKLWEIPAPGSTYFIREFIPRGLSGEKHSEGEDSRHIFGSFNSEPEGQENIPPSGAILVTPNHWENGPFNGQWIHLETTRVVKDARLDDKDLHWIARRHTYIPGTSIPMPFSSMITAHVAKMYSGFLVEPPQAREKNKKAHTVGQIRPIAEAFKAGEAIGIYPETEESTRLKRGHYLAGLAAHGLARLNPEGMVCPVGLYSDDRNNLSVKFGKAYSISELLDKFGWILPREETEKRKVCRKISDYMMKKINPLVPVQYRFPEAP